MDEKQQNNEHPDLAWAVIDSGSRRLVGRIPPGLAPGDKAHVEEAVELDVGCTRLPAGPQGQVATLYSPSMVPIDLEEGPTYIDVVISNVRYYADMNDRGRRYEEMYGQLMDQMVQARARRAGLSMANSLPQQGNPQQGNPQIPPGMPPGFMRPNGFGGGQRES